MGNAYAVLDPLIISFRRVCAPAARRENHMKRSKRIEALDARPVNLDGYINEWPEMGFIAMSSPYDPKPSVKVENGKIVELDGRSREEFDFIDQFIADYAINIDRAETSMAVSSLEIARMIVDINVSRKEILELI